LARRRRKRRSAELRNSLRLGVLLAGLVGINVYVFFFNRGTAPREVLNLQSTSKTMDGSRHELLAKDAGAARTLVASASKPGGPATARSVGLTSRFPTEGRAPAARVRAGEAAAPPVFQIPFSLPQTLTSVSPVPRAPASHGVIQVPWAPPPEDDGPGPAAAEDGTIEKKFGTADTLGQVLAREGFGASTGNIVAALAKLMDPKTIQGGQKYFVRMDDSGAPEGFEYQPSAVLRYIVERDDEGSWQARKAEQAVEVQTIEAGGLVESSLYESVQKAGESTTLVASLVELFAWDVNFYVDTHPGDHWKVVVEKQLLGGRFYKYGRILAAEYGGKVGTFRAFYFVPRGGKANGNGDGKAPGRYYDDHGQAISKTMLKTPLRFVRISSKFDRRRLHPILHIEKAHLGIDYAAPVGTPVWASAGGRVVEAGGKRGSGNTVVLTHANGISTRYYHLSRFARGLHVGQSVRQKDVIGFVGTTGLSTGPHLHFSVTKNGAFVDPNKMQVSRDAPVADRAGFLDAIRPRLASLRNIQPGAVARN
jgi:murein DD-endopeptidase MepM/ murein hydrolase activator NlpD